MAGPRTLPVAQQVSEEVACCAACAAERSGAVEPAAPAVPVRPAIPVRTPISRDADRRITFGGLVVAASLLALAAASLALPSGERHGLWLPLHLALAGAAGTAIAAVLPFFSAAIAVAPPSAPAVRVAGIGLLAVGALVVSGAVVRDAAVIAVTGGVGYLVGLGVVAVAAFSPLRGPLAPQRRFIGGAYALAIAQVAAGVVMATALLAGFAPVADHWAALKPAHAWLNVFGFLSVVVAVSLVHLAPTVAGSRIKARASAMSAALLLLVGPPLVAVGFALGADVVARAGALVELVGALALATHGVVVLHDRGQWTTDGAWHRMAGWSLTLAPAWFLVGVGIAAGRVLWFGAVPAAWSVEIVAAPMVLGWVLQVLIGSWTHLVPSIGPGDQRTHSRQRGILGRWATSRLLLLNGGTALVVAGSVTGAPSLLAAGGIACLASLVAALATLTAAAATTRTGGHQPIRVAPSGAG